MVRDKGSPEHSFLQLTEFEIESKSTIVIDTLYAVFSTSLSKLMSKVNLTRFRLLSITSLVQLRIYTRTVIVVCMGPCFFVTVTYILMDIWPWGHIFWLPCKILMARTV